jgi:hypothetical protein
VLVDYRVEQSYRTTRTPASVSAYPGPNSHSRALSESTRPRGELILLSEKGWVT